jgi:hypothetical protein
MPKKKDVPKFEFKVAETDAIFGVKKVDAPIGVPGELFTIAEEGQYILYDRYFNETVIDESELNRRFTQIIEDDLPF